VFSHSQGTEQRGSVTMVGQYRPQERPERRGLPYIVHESAKEAIHSVIFMWSLLPKDLLQFGHLRDLEVKRSSTHSLQKTCPQVLITVSLKLRLQTVQMASAWHT
jgi:hypothetical protein